MLGMALRGEEWSVSCEGIGEQQGDGRTGARKDDGNALEIRFGSSDLRSSGRGEYSCND